MMHRRKKEEGEFPLSRRDTQGPTLVRILLAPEGKMILCITEAWWVLPGSHSKGEKKKKA